MFTLASWTGSSRDGRTPACAARWKTTSGGAPSNSDASPSARTSMVKNENSLPYPRASTRLGDATRGEVVDRDDAQSFGQESFGEL